MDSNQIFKVSFRYNENKMLPLMISGMRPYVAKNSFYPGQFLLYFVFSMLVSMSFYPQSFLVFFIYTFFFFILGLLGFFISIKLQYKKMNYLFDRAYIFELYKDSLVISDEKEEYKWTYRKHDIKVLLESENFFIIKTKKSFKRYIYPKDGFNKENISALKEFIYN